MGNTPFAVKGPGPEPAFVPSISWPALPLPAGRGAPGGRWQDPAPALPPGAAPCRRKISIWCKEARGPSQSPGGLCSFPQLSSPRLLALEALWGMGAEAASFPRPREGQRLWMACQRLFFPTARAAGRGRGLGRRAGQLGQGDRTELRQAVWGIPARPPCYQTFPSPPQPPEMPHSICGAL